MQHTSGMEALLVLLLLLPAMFLTGLAILDPVDYLALQSLRKSLADLPGSAFLAAWDFTADPCGFPGVLCAGGRVVELALGDPRAGSPGLAGRLDPESLARLSALAELSIVPGRVAGPIPPALPPALTFLALSGNLFSGSLPPSLPSLRRLRTLDLSSNRLSGQIPQTLARLPRLANLILSHNFLSGQIPNFPASSPLLRLDLKRNALSGHLPSLPPSLNHLDLSFNALSGSIPGRIFSLPISDLQLQRNDFSGELHPPSPMSAAIDRLDLSHNRLEGQLPAALAAVRVLYLNDNRFTGVLPVAFVDRVLAGGIRQLYLQHNYLAGITGMGPAAVIPAGASLCLQYNCMVPPNRATCPLRVGRRKTRPAAQCPPWRKG